MKKLFLTILVITFTTISFAQKIKIKKNEVTVDGTHILNYEKSSGYNFSIYDLNDDEIIFFKYHNNETSEYYDDDYFILQFFNEDMKIETTESGWVPISLSTKKYAQKFLGWLMKEKVMDKTGQINAEKLKRFAQKYEENITNRTIRN